MMHDKVVISIPSFGTGVAASVMRKAKERPSDPSLQEECFVIQ
jgi:hypothetical protein